MLRFISTVFCVLTFVAAGSACDGGVNLPDGPDTELDDGNFQDSDEDLKADGNIESDADGDADGGGDPDADVEPGGELTLALPSEVVVGVPATFSGTAGVSIKRVVISVDGWEIAEEMVSGGQYSFEYTFNTPGQNRFVQAVGFDSGSQIVDTVSGYLDVLDAEVEFTLALPSEAVVGVPATFSGTAPVSIKRVVVSVDGWEIADEMVSGGQYSFEYTFNTPGQNRFVQAVGFDSGSQIVDTVSGYLDVVNAGSFISGVPYFYQYHNAINPGGSCQNTSMAMILKFYGANSITPDEISNHYGTSQAQTVAGFQQVFNSEAAYFGLSWRDAGTTTGSLADVHAQLAAGIPVVVHGYFTEYGHVIVLVGYDGDVYWAHDPAGKWNQVYMGGGYSGNNASEGKYVTYSAASVNAAIAPDGFVWMHAFYQI